MRYLLPERLEQRSHALTSSKKARLDGIFSNPKHRRHFGCCKVVVLRQDEDITLIIRQLCCCARHRATDLPTVLVGLWRRRRPDRPIARELGLAPRRHSPSAPRPARGALQL